MYVKEWMTKNPICLSADSSIMDAYNAMNEGNFHNVPITDKGKLVGLVTDKKLAEYSPSKATTLSVFEINSLLQKTTCGEIMLTDIPTVSPDSLLEEAADKMLKFGCNCLPVISDDTGILVGLITNKKIFGTFIELMGYYSEGSRVVVELEEDVPGIMSKISSSLAQNNINISHLTVYHTDNIKLVIRVDDKDVDKVKNVLTSIGHKVIDARVNDSK